MSDGPFSVIVTGGGSGIGRAAALLLGQAGHPVMVADLNSAAGEAVVAEIVAAKGRAAFCRTDVAHEESVQRLVATTCDQLGPLRYALNCAGIAQHGRPVHELDAAQWDHGMAVNLRGMFLCVKYQGKAMLAAGAGSIVCVASVAATKGLINSAEYCASKAGITGLVRAAAIDFARQGVRINALLPGATDTPLVRQSQAANPQIKGTLPVPMGRRAAAGEIAAGAVWLLSDAASYTTGSCLTIDGGMSIG